MRITPKLNLNSADAELNSKCERDKRQGTKYCIYDRIYFEKQAFVRSRAIGSVNVWGHYIWLFHFSSFWMCARQHVGKS